jgi:hypothetical protein
MTSRYLAMGRQSELLNDAVFDHRHVEFRSDLLKRGAGEMQLPMLQWVDAIRLFWPWRHSPSNLSSAGVRCDRAHRLAGPAAPGSSVRYVCL